MVRIAVGSEKEEEKKEGGLRVYIYTHLTPSAVSASTDSTNYGWGNQWKKKSVCGEHI